MKTVSQRGMRTLYMSHNAFSKGDVTARNDMCSRVTRSKIKFLINFKKMALFNLINIPDQYILFFSSKINNFRVLQYFIKVFESKSMYIEKNFFRILSKTFKKLPGFRIVTDRRVIITLLK